MEVTIPSSITISVWFPFSVYARDAGQFHLLGSSMWIEASSSLMLFSKLFSRLFNFYTLRGVLYSLPWYWYSNLKETAIHMLVGRNIYTINWSTQLMTGLFVQGKGYLQSPLCWDSQGFCFVFLTVALISDTLHYSLSFMGALLLPIHTEPSSVFKFYLSDRLLNPLCVERVKNRVFWIYQSKYVSALRVTNFKFS